MTTFVAIPTFEQTLTQPKGGTNKVWYLFWRNLLEGAPPAAEYAITPTTSPFIFQAPQKGFLIVQGGTVIMVQFSRNGVTNYNTGAIAGCFPVSLGDSITVRYTSAPTLTFVPQ